jgi:hypothetical protein
VFFIHVKMAVSGKVDVQPCEILTSFIHINVYWNVTLSGLVHTPDVLQQYDAIIFMAGQSIVNLYQISTKLRTLRRIAENGS